MQRSTIDTEEVRWHKCFSRNLLLDPGITVDQGNQDKVWQVKSPVSCNSFACLLYIYPVARGKRRLLTDRGGQRTRVRLDRWFLRCQRETAGLTPDNLELESSRSSRPTACRRPSCCPWSSVKGDWSALVVSWGRRWELVYWSPTGWSTP